MKYVFCLFVFLSSLSLHAQVWEKLYGNDSTIYSPDLAVPCYDKGILVVSSTIPFGQTAIIGDLIKTDINGTVLWEKHMDSAVDIDAALSLKDGSMILGGAVSKSIYILTPFIVKLDPCGDTLWATMLIDTDANGAYLNNIQQKQNGDILAVSYNYGNANPSVLFCFDSNGKFKWKYREGSLINHYLLNKNGTIFLSGDIYLHDTYLPPGIVIIHTINSLIDSNGGKIWSDIYGNTPPYKYGFWGLGFKTKDKGYLGIHRNDDDSAVHEGNFYAVKLDSNGQKEWVKYFGDTTVDEAIADGLPLNDSTYLVVGCAADTSLLNDYIRVMKISATGKVLAKKDFFVGSISYAINIRPAYDGKYIVCCRARINGISNTLLLKIDSDMNIVATDTSIHYTYDYLCPNKILNGDTIHLPHVFDSISVDTMLLYTGVENAVFPLVNVFKIYPNPFTNSTNISYTLQQSENVKIEVMDIMGRNIATLVNSKQETGNHNAIFNASNYTSANAGIYIVRMTVGACVTNKQIVLVK